MTVVEEGNMSNLQELFNPEILYLSRLVIAFIVCGEGKKSAFNSDRLRYIICNITFTDLYSVI